MPRFRVAQCYTGGVGSEIIRRLSGHPLMQLVGVLVHDPAKAGRDAGELVGAPANGVLTTTALDDILRLKPDGAIWSGKLYDVDAYARILEAGVNLYTGMGGYFIEGCAEEGRLGPATAKGHSSFCAGGNIPGLVSDVLPLFLSGYTGRIRRLSAWQRNHVAGNHSKFQLLELLGLGRPPGASALAERVSAGWVSVAEQSSRMIAKGMGLRWESAELVKVDYGFAPHRTVLEASGTVIEQGTVAGVRWTLAARANGREFYRLVNEQTAMLGLGEDWRQTLEAPAWRVEIDGDPPIVSTFGWGADAEPGRANTQLNAARAVNMLPRVINARPGLLTVLDFPAAVAGDGLAPTR
jgi:4-hydroxy-tetrahydrodipicolinate reductase